MTVLPCFAEQVSITAITTGENRRRDRDATAYDTHVVVGGDGLEPPTLSV